jgi:hypothetical protein
MEELEAAVERDRGIILHEFESDHGFMKTAVTSKNKMWFRSPAGANFCVILILIVCAIVGITIRIQFDIQILTPHHC